MFAVINISMNIKSDVFVMENVPTDDSSLLTHWGRVTHIFQ